MFSSMKLLTNHKRASDPRMLVITICPIAPTLIDTRPIIRFLGDRKKTLPPNSPILFGVKTAQVNPQKTDSTAFHVLIFSTPFNKYFHFRASRNQLSSISKNKIIATIQTSTGARAVASERKSLILRLLLSFWKINPKANIKMATLITILRFLFAERFNRSSFCNVKKKLRRIRILKKALPANY